MKWHNGAKILNVSKIIDNLEVTCCWWAKVCFMRTILMLCSIAYFFALFTVSCCSDVIFGKPPPNMPGSVRYLAPGPIKIIKWKDITQISIAIQSNKKDLFTSDLISKTSIRYCSQCSILLELNWLKKIMSQLIWYIIFLR